MMGRIPTLEGVRAAVIASGGVWFWTPSKPWNANLLALRTPSREANRFDDAICWACHDDDGRALWRVWKATTDPGTFQLSRGTTSKGGAAVLAPGQYRSTHTIRDHGSSNPYPAICHRYDVPDLPVYRDYNADNRIDLDGPIYRNGRGINVHRASAYRESTQVDRWSAGCIVHAAPDTFDEMMVLARLSAAAWGNRFTLTLLHWPSMIWST
tara:strand:+ start:1555 stop:2187 length:633 start_codon:yes stop_codon:yes gene_type:complete